MLFIKIIFTVAEIDSAQPWQIGFQDPATPVIEGIIDFHHDIILLTENRCRFAVRKHHEVFDDKLTSVLCQFVTAIRYRNAEVLSMNKLHRVFIYNMCVVTNSISNRCLVDVESTDVDIRRTRHKIAVDPTDNYYLGIG